MSKFSKTVRVCDRCGVKRDEVSIFDITFPDDPRVGVPGWLDVDKRLCVFGKEKLRISEDLDFCTKDCAALYFKKAAEDVLNFGKRFERHKVDEVKDAK